MSIFDLFRGFFGVPGGPYGRYGPREPFFDSMTHDDEDDEDDEVEDYYSGSFQGPGGHDPFDDAWRFGFSMGPNGMRLHEPAMFGQILRDMEEIFAELGHLGERHGPFGVPSLEPPHSPQGKCPHGEPGGNGNSLRDFMLKGPEDKPSPPGPPPSGTTPGRHGSTPGSPFRHWSPFSRFHDGFRDSLFSASTEDKREDGDLDSQVSSGGLDQILTPAQPAAPDQPRMRSFFQSVTVKKVVKPDGTVEETRTVRDSQGNEETTVTRSGGSGDSEGSQGPSGSLLSEPFDMQDHMSMFSRFFGGFRG